MARQLGDKAIGLTQQLNRLAEADLEAGGDQYRTFRQMVALAADVKPAALRKELVALIEAAADKTQGLVERNRDAWQIGIFMCADRFDLADDVVMRINKAGLQARRPNLDDTQPMPTVTLAKAKK